MLNRIFKALDVSRHSTTWVFDNFNYLMFLGFLGIVYIANAHFAEKSIRDIQRTEKEIKELKWEYISIKSETMYKSMQSQISESVTDDKLFLESEGPKVLVSD
jgi:glucosamine 6-phosphate synthetase-like amidotransferase/phosphosugar isomerase protein